MSIFSCDVNVLLNTVLSGRNRMTMLLNQVEEHKDVSRGVAEEVTACSFCKGDNIVFDAERGEKLCSDCGIVLAEGVETEDLGLDTKDRIDTTLHNGISSSLM